MAYFLPFKHIKCFPIPLFRHIVKFYFVQLMIIDFHNIYLGAILRILTNALSSFKSPRKQILKTLPSIINQIQLFILAKKVMCEKLPLSRFCNQFIEIQN